MPVTPSQLVKALHPFLAKTINARNLREWGWLDYLSLESHTSNDPVEVACAALLYLVVGDEGQFLGREHVVVGVINFANDRTGRLANAAQIHQLVAIFKTPPISPDTVHEWFDLVYR